MTCARRKPLPVPPANFEQWAIAAYEIADALLVAREIRGYVYRGLGLDLRSSSTSRYKRKDGTRRQYSTWCITHLNTGHVIRWLHDQPVERAFALATDLADVADWDFVGLYGWKNSEPDIQDKLQAWQRRHELGTVSRGSAPDEAIAQAIGSKRW